MPYPGRSSKLEWGRWVSSLVDDAQRVAWDRAFQSLSDPLVCRMRVILRRAAALTGLMVAAPPPGWALGPTPLRPWFPNSRTPG